MPAKAPPPRRVDLSDKTVLITGSNSGIGLETASSLAGMGARVLLAVRDPGRGATAKEHVERGVSGARVEVVELDLADLTAVRRAVDDVERRVERLDVLVNNAGVVMRRRRETTQGIEMTFGVNHVGHFLLTELLRPLLLASVPSRVVIVASDAHKFARRGLDLFDLQSTKRYGVMDAYGKSKLANLLHMRELARRLDGTGVTANAVHPGPVRTNLARDGDGGRLGEIAMKALGPFFLTAEEGARTSIHVASSPDLATVNGVYFALSEPAVPTRWARDDAAAAALWRASELLTGLA